MANYIPTIGLEIHAELNTRTKMFCASLNDAEEKRPNVNICPICMGHPGTLPVPNIEAIKKVIKVGLALGCKIAEFSKFDRKNYFYPDLPKGYQISQYDKPFCEGGYLEIMAGSDSDSLRRIRITRIHLEEDAGRLLHPKGADYSLVDFNRAGIPLMELVTEPDMHSGEEAQRFAEELQLILKYLGASDANMEKGQMRVELNISLAPEELKELGTKVEVKNLNSFNAVARAAAYEIKRQSELLDNGGRVIQETRGWDENTQKTFSQRAKEEAHDYRYFPEPDIPPIKVSDFPPKADPPLAGNFFAQGGSPAGRQFSGLPELPQQKRRRFVEEYKIDAKLAEIFVRDRELADYYEKVISEFLAWEKAHGHTSEQQETRDKLIILTANYLTTDLRRLFEVNNMTIGDCKISPENFAEFVDLIHDGKLSSRAAKDLLPEMLRTGGDPHQLMLDKGLGQVSEASELGEVVDKVIKDNPGPILEYKSGKENILQFLVGQAMKETKGRANPQVAAEILKRKLSQNIRKYQETLGD